MQQGLLFTAETTTFYQDKNRYKGGKNWLFNSLLNGCYIRERGGRSKRYQFCLFEMNAVPVKKISDVQMRSLRGLLKENKVRGQVKYSLNLREVRALHGNCSLKKLYRKHKLLSKTIL